MTTYEKTVGDLTVYASEPSPRFVDIHYKYGYGRQCFTLTITEVRTLQHMLAQVLELADKDEAD